MTAISVNLAVEDALSETVARRILSERSTQRLAVARCYCRGGYGYLKRSIVGFNSAARVTPFLVLSDLQAACPPAQVAAWLPIERHPNLLFRIAVREVEAWLLADRDGFASFLGVSKQRIPREPDNIPDAKQCLINLARRSRKRSLREAIVPAPRSTASIGPDYNGALSEFTAHSWNIGEAAQSSDSLRRALKAIDTFQLA